MVGGRRVQRVAGRPPRLAAVIRRRVEPGRCLTTSTTFPLGSSMQRRRPCLFASCAMSLLRPLIGMLGSGLKS